MALVIAAALSAAAMPAVASAESLCTDTWVGPAEGRWLVEANWSTGKVPSSSDVACIGSGHVVTVDNTAAAAVVQGPGSLVVSNATLEVVSLLEPSSIGSLTLASKATLTGKAEVDVASSFTGGGGSYLLGGGAIVIEAGATGTVAESSGAGLTMEEWTLTNKGTFTVGLNSGLNGNKGAKLVNSGTLIVNGEPSGGSHGLGSGEATLMNTGTVEKTEGSGLTTVGFVIENEGSVTSLSGALGFTHGGGAGAKSAGSWSSSGSGSKLVFGGSTAFSLGASGHIEISGPAVTAGRLEGPSATVTLDGPYFTTMELTGSAPSTLSGLEMIDPEKFLAGPVIKSTDEIDVTSSFLAAEKSTMTGKGKLVIEPGATGIAATSSTSSLKLEEGWTLENEGTLTIGRSAGIEGSYEGGNQVTMVNTGTLIVNGETYGENHGLIGRLNIAEASVLYNYGIVKKTEGALFSEIQWLTYNYGPIFSEVGKLYLYYSSSSAPKLLWGGEENPSTPNFEFTACAETESVSCATGNFSQKQTDIALGGLGVGLSWGRTYNSQAAAEGIHGPLGYGWSSSFSDHIVSEPSQHRATLIQGNGSYVAFSEGTGGTFTPPGSTQDTLSGSSGTSFTLTLEDQTVYKFAGASGRLESVTDRNGNETKLAYNGEGRLETITDPDGRTITLAYNGEGLVESATDPMKHVVKYAYEGGNLTSVTEPGESSLRWRFKYDSSHQATEMIDGRSGKTKIEYDSSHRVISQIDPMERQLTFEYRPMQTTTTNHATGAITLESFASTGEAVAITHGYGTASATTEFFTYNTAGDVLAKTDGDGHTTKYGYDTHGNRTGTTDPEGHETKWTYDSTHDVETETKPNGEKTTYKRDGHGNVLAEERPAPGETTQTTSYKYDAHGDRESMTNPVGKTWKYEYDSAGDQTVEVDPEGDKRTWGYNEDSQETSTVSPRGHVSGASETVFTTTTERDAQGRPIAVSEPPREPSYNSTFGSAGSENGQFQFPTLEALTSSGDVWVVDSTLDRLQEFNEKGEYLTQFGSAGTGGGQFKFPFGIGIEPGSGDIVVVDREQDRVEVFSSAGVFIRTFGWGVSNGEAKVQVCTKECRAGIRGSNAGQFYNPDGLAIDSSGNVWIVDETENRLVEYTEAGEYLREFGGRGSEAGKLSQPVGLAYDQGNLYVTEAGNQRVQEFSTSGSYLNKFGSEGTARGQFKIPYAIAVGPVTHELYVTDRENNRVEVFTPTGEFVESFGVKGKGSGQMELPTGVVANASETLYVSDHTNKRVDVWTGLPSRITKYAYDGDGNVETKTDPEGNATTYTYDADNEPTKIKEPNGTVIETGYDGAGQVTSQTDGNKHTTTYARDVLEQVTEEIDPLSHKTIREYDKAGNLIGLTDAAERKTTYKYNADNQVVEVSYSDGKTPTVTYEYNADGRRTKMVDGTGTSTYHYDALDRMTEAEDGNKEVVKYEYDLANHTTKITYPNGKSVTRAFDQDGRLEKVTDWLSHTTTFGYDPDSNVKITLYPSESKDEDRYVYNDADQMIEVDMFQGAASLASVAYAHDGDGDVKTVLAKGLPGAESTESSYDQNRRVTKYGSTEYKYDAANNPTTEGSATNTYNEGDGLEKGSGVSYTYDEVGERTKSTPEKGPATTYGYDQAENLISVERPAEGETPKVEDTYAYDGDGLRASQTVNGSTTHMAWDTAEELALILNDATNSYIYGLGGLPIEQINNNTSAVTYLHHDQQGSTRLLTSSTGKVEEKCTYSAYGTQTCEGGASTPLRYDGQYTDSDTGLVYLRARYYDPATAQFLSIDPAVGKTREPYEYAGDTPLAESDPSGECAAMARTAGNTGARVCEDLLEEIKITVKNLERRLRQLRENRRGLPPGEVKKYLKAFEQKQRALQKSLRQWSRKNLRGRNWCNDFRGGV